MTLFVFMWNQELFESGSNQDQHATFNVLNQIKDIWAGVGF